MSCTTYDDLLAYNAPIAYNGVCTTPPSPQPIPVAMGWGLPLRKKKRKPESEEDEVIAIMLAEFLEDD